MEIVKVSGVESQRTVYYPAGGAFRVIVASPASNTLYFRHTDQLGSTSVLSDSTGAKVANPVFNDPPQSGRFSWDYLSIGAGWKELSALTVNVKWDRYGNIYLAGNLGAGAGYPVPVSVSATAGYITPTGGLPMTEAGHIPEDQMESDIAGVSSFVQGSLGVQGQISGNPIQDIANGRDGTSVKTKELGFGTPSISAGVSYTALIYDANSPSPWTNGWTSGKNTPWWLK